MKDRLAPCIYYECKGQCSKGFEAEQKGICQHCNKYQARKGFKVVDKRRKEKRNIMNNTELDVLYICKGWYNDKYESTLDALNAYYHREYGNEDITMDYRFVLNLFLKPCLIKYGTKNSIRCLLEPTMLESSMDYNQTPMSKDYMLYNRALTAIINLKKSDIFDNLEEKENII